MSPKGTALKNHKNHLMSVPTGTFGGPLWLGKSHRTRDGGTRPLRIKGYDTKEHKRNMRHPQEQEPPAQEQENQEQKVLMRQQDGRQSRSVAQLLARIVGT